MRIAIAGGTGVVGSRTAQALTEGGHEVVLLTRGHGVDLLGGSGVDAALAGVDAVIDTLNVSTVSAKKSTEFFTRATGNLVSAAHRAGVGHVVLLSIVGIDRIPHDYYAGKLAQEQVVENGPVPWTILRATQFHEFAGQLLERTSLGPVHLAIRARVQPIAAREVGARLAELATASPLGRAADLAGPREEALHEMMRAHAQHTGVGGPILTVSVPGKQMRGMRDGLALPGPGSDLGRQTFSDWLTDLGVR